MKCHHWIVWIMRNDKRKKFVVEQDRDSTVKETLRRLSYFKQPPVLTEPEICGGAITATVSAVDDPFFGGTSAELEISYVCSRCGTQILPYEFKLPRTESDLSNWLTRWVASLQEGYIVESTDISDA